ncbi:MAG: hypothetical protein IKR13_01055 [Victivallales bacterium]|nr:hypothetical protein [Victivallales bacterium]
MQKNSSFHLKDGECVVLPDTACPVDQSKGLRRPDLDAFVRPEFPLTASRLENLCTRCWHPSQTRPLSQETGEETSLGFFYRQRLHAECQMLLSRPIAVMDRWEVRRAMETFAANPQIFCCRSIYLVLSYCEEYMRKLFGGDTLTELMEPPRPTAFEEALEFHEKHALPQHRRPDE